MTGCIAFCCCFGAMVLMQTRLVQKTQQQEQMHMLMTDVADIAPFQGDTIPRSPRAHTPVLSPFPVSAVQVSGPVTLRKYYKPLPAQLPTPIANDLFARIIRLSNAPEMQTASDEDIMAHVGVMIDKAMNAKGDT